MKNRLHKLTANLPGISHALTLIGEMTPSPLRQLSQLQPFELRQPLIPCAYFNQQTYLTWNKPSLDPNRRDYTFAVETVLAGVSQLQPVGLRQPLVQLQQSKTSWDAVLGTVDTLESGINDRLCDQNDQDQARSEIWNNYMS